MLCLDIAWLTGTAFLARDPSDLAPDWPPQPDRIFSALVASWGSGGEDRIEREALEWLEAQKSPRLHLPEPAHPRRTVKVYVPPNDAKGITVLPTLRKRQERTFPCVALDPGSAVHLSLIWEAAPSDEHRAALEKIARRTSHVGHSASMVRAMFREIDATPEGLQPARRAPYQGRLRQLEDLHRRHMTGDSNARPRPAMPRRTPPVASSKPRHFATDPTQCFVLEHAGGDRADLRAAAR